MVLNPGTNQYHYIVVQMGVRSAPRFLADFWHVRAKRARFGGTTVLLCGTNYWYKLVPLYSGTKSWYKSVPLYSGTNGRAKRAPIFGMSQSTRVLETPLPNILERRSQRVVCFSLRATKSLGTGFRPIKIILLLLDS